MRRNASQSAKLIQAIGQVPDCRPAVYSTPARLKRRCLAGKHSLRLARWRATGVNIPDAASDGTESGDTFYDCTRAPGLLPSTPLFPVAACGYRAWMKTHALSALLAVAAMSVSVRAADLTPFQQTGRDVFKELIETDTTHSTGDTTKAAQQLAQRFRDAGFAGSDIQILGPSNRNQNLILRYHG